MFIFYDGDNIGEVFASLYKTNNLAKLKLLSQTISDIHAEIKEKAENIEARVIEAGGDEGLINCPGCVSEVGLIVAETFKQYGLKVTIGSGACVAEAFEVCELNKSRTKVRKGK